MLMSFTYYKAQACKEEKYVAIQQSMSQSIISKFSTNKVCGLYVIVHLDGPKP